MSRMKSITQMKFKPAALALFAVSLKATDILTLNNGDRLTGAIQKLDNGKLSLKYGHNGTLLQLEWQAVTAVSTDDEFQITTCDGKRIIGKLDSSFAPLNILAIQPKQAEQETSPREWWRKAWENTSISADLDQTYSGLASYNQFSWTAEFEYTGDRWESSVAHHFYYYGATESSGSTYQTYARVLNRRYLGGDHLFLFSHAFFGRQTSLDDGRGSVHEYGGGLGWTFGRHRNDSLSVYAGVVRSVVHGDIRLDDPLYIAAVAWNKKVHKKLELTLQVFGYKPILDGRHIALATDSSAKIPLFGKTYFTIRAYDTPEAEQKHLFSIKNLQVSSGIGIEF
jgi:hypothetical protein